MKKEFFFLLVFSFMSIPPLQAWNESDHSLMTELALRRVAEEWKLDIPVSVHSLQQFLDQAALTRPTLNKKTEVPLKKTEEWNHYLKIHPSTELSTDPGHSGDKIRFLTPIQILAEASNDPDDGRDRNLYIEEGGRKKPLYPSQKWFGAPSGPNSQAFRHIEKPPFQWKHPINTFGFPFSSVGEASERAEIYYQAALLAFSLKEEGWGWRFLGSCLHYLQDLHNPYHAGQISPALLFRGLSGYLSWGRESRGFFGTFTLLIGNSHRFFEHYVSTPSEKDQTLKQNAIRELDKKSFVEKAPPVHEIARQVRDESNLSFERLTSLVTRIADEKLASDYDFENDEQAKKNPQLLLKKDVPVQEMQELFRIVEKQFDSSGVVIRTVVYKALQEALLTNPEQQWITLDHLLSQ